MLALFKSQITGENTYDKMTSGGAVKSTRTRGARIATLADAHLAHLFEVIAALEAEGGRLACERIRQSLGDLQ